MTSLAISTEAGYPISRLVRLDLYCRCRPVNPYRHSPVSGRNCPVLRATEYRREWADCFKVAGGPAAANARWPRHEPVLINHSPEGVMANSEFTLWAKKTSFTRSATTPPKVNQLGWNLEKFEPNVGGWPWKFFGAQ